MSGSDFKTLYDSILSILRHSQTRGAFSYESDLLGEKGTFFTMDDFFVGYKEGKPCPECGTPIVQIKTGALHCLFAQGVNIWCDQEIVNV